MALARRRDGDPRGRALAGAAAAAARVHGRVRRRPARDAEERAQALARELGLLGRVVLFNDGWVPYDERGAWLLQADCAVAAHRDHLETRFAFRTRLLDCFWAGLPIVCTRGDELAERIERDGLGAAVAAADPAALAAGSAAVLDRGRGAYAGRLAAAAGRTALVTGG